MAPFALHLEFLLEEYAGNKGRYPPVKRHRKNSIYICTIEKAANLINSLVEYGRLHEIGLLVVDELHLIGEGSGRGATLERLLTELIYTNGKTVPHYFSLYHSFILLLYQIWILQLVSTLLV